MVREFIRKDEEWRNMKQYHLEKSPIVYYISRKEKTEWILFIHAAFVNHNMFQTQIDYFRDKYNILTLDIIGHGKSTKCEKVIV